MENKMIDGVKVAVNYAQASDAPVSDDEIKAYIKRAYDATRAEEHDRVKPEVPACCK